MQFGRIYFAAQSFETSIIHRVLSISKNKMTNFQPPHFNKDRLQG